MPVYASFNKTTKRCMRSRPSGIPGIENGRKMPEIEQLCLCLFNNYLIVI